MITWSGYRPTIDPTFADAVDAALAPLSALWVVTSGLRTNAEQAVLYARGRTAPGEIVTDAQPGASPHNWGLAIDVALKRGQGALSWDFSQPEWLILWAAVRVAPILHSGEDFPGTFQDPPHIERLHWRDHLSAPPESQT